MVISAHVHNFPDTTIAICVNKFSMEYLFVALLAWIVHNEKQMIGKLIMFSYLI